MLKKMLKHLMNFKILCLSAFFLLSIASYSKHDPSFYKTSSSDQIHNIFGIWGAYLADPIISIFGITSVIPFAFAVYYSLRSLLAKHESNFALRCISLILCIPFSSLTLQGIAHILSVKSTLGGAIGDFLLAEYMIHFNFNIPVMLAFTFASIFLILSCFIDAVQSIRFIATLCINTITWFFQWSVWSMKRLLQKLKCRFNKPENLEELQYKLNQQKPKTIVEIVSQTKTNKDSKAKIQSSLKLEPEAFELPSTLLLKAMQDKAKKFQLSENALSQNSKLLHQVLQDFGIKGEITKIHPGPVVTLYEFEPEAGIKSSRIIGLSDDIARSMSSMSARIAVIPGKSSLGIELPNAHREIVSLRQLFETKAYQESAEKLPLVLGKNIAGESVIADLAKMPHLLVAGTTGSGKSVAINTMILSLLYHHSPKTCKFIMIDPKMLELSIYEGIPHLLAPVVTEPKKAIIALKWVVKEMENRYRQMSICGVRNLEGYNEALKEMIRLGKKLEKEVQVGFDHSTGSPKYETVALSQEPLPFIVVIVDEMADLMLVAGKDIETSIQRLAQMARAAGIHIIMATQRPSVDVITGVIKANFPTRISFQVTSKIDSRTILGEQGAEQLLGMGDMLFMRGGGRIERVHGPFVSDAEVEAVTTFLKAQGAPQYIENITLSDEEDEDSQSSMSMNSGDELYDKAVAIVLKDRKASTSYVQRCLRLGYNRAAILIERMEKEGIVSPPNHSGKREILIGEE